MSKEIQDDPGCYCSACKDIRAVRSATYDDMCPECRGPLTGEDHFLCRDHVPTDDGCACGWTAPLGTSLWREFDKHLRRTD